MRENCEGYGLQGKATSTPRMVNRFEEEAGAVAVLEDVAAMASRVMTHGGYVFKFDGNVLMLSFYHFF